MLKIYAGSDFVISISLSASLLTTTTLLDTSAGCQLRFVATILSLSTFRYFYLFLF